MHECGHASATAPVWRPEDFNNRFSTYCGFQQMNSGRHPWWQALLIWLFIVFLMVIYYYMILVVFNMFLYFTSITFSVLPVIQGISSGSEIAGSTLSLSHTLSLIQPLFSVLRQGLTSVALTVLKLCRPRWPRTHRRVPAGASKPWNLRHVPAYLQ